LRKIKAISSRVFLYVFLDQQINFLPIHPYRIIALLLAYEQIGMFFIQKFMEYAFSLCVPHGHSDISVTMNVYTHIGFDDAEEELKRMEEFRKAQAEVEQKKEKPMSQKMFKVI